MDNSSINYFINSNSSLGYVSYYESNFGKLKRAIRLNAYPLELTQPLFGEIRETAMNRSLKVETVRNCLDNSLEGVIVPELSAGIINLPVYDTNEHNALALIGNENMETVRGCLASAYQKFAEARKIHDDWEKVFIKNTNFSVLDKLADQTVLALVGEKRQDRDAASIDRYFGAASVNGSIDYIDNITCEIEHRYFLKGRPGTGKSTFLKKVANVALEHGYDVEIYHCAFDPNSLDLIAVRGLDFCMFDSTSPHEYFPARRNDEIIDIYSACVKEGTDELYADELAGFQAGYKAKVGAATDYLRQAKNSYGIFQSQMLSVIDEAAWKETKDKILASIFG